jgi:hypothetical protein
MFTNLCGQDAMPNVVFVTTMWSELVAEETGARREEELKSFLAEMEAGGCAVERFQETAESAWGIVDRLSSKALEGLRHKQYSSPMGPTSTARSSFNFLSVPLILSIFMSAKWKAGLEKALEEQMERQGAQERLPAKIEAARKAEPQWMASEKKIAAPPPTVMTKVKPNSIYGVGSVEVDSNGDRARRLAITADKLVTQPCEGVQTVTDVIAYAARTYGTKHALGWRDIVDIHEEENNVKKIIGGKEVTEKKVWKYLQLSDYKYINFIEVQERISEIARGLHHHGVTTDDVFNIYATTR